MKKYLAMLSIIGLAGAAFADEPKPTNLTINFENRTGENLNFQYSKYNPKSGEKPEFQNIGGLKKIGLSSGQNFSTTIKSQATNPDRAYSGEYFQETSNEGVRYVFSAMMTQYNEIEYNIQVPGDHSEKYYFLGTCDPTKAENYHPTWNVVFGSNGGIEKSTLKCN